MQPQNILETIRFLTVIIILAYASYCDIKTGQVPNKTWIYTPIGLAMTTLSLLVYPILTALTLVSITMATALSLLLFYFGAWGGADAKALILIAVCTPLYPLWHTLTYTPFLLLPLTTLLIASPIAIIAATIRKPKDLLHAKIRFLPFTLTGYIITILIVTATF